MHKKAFLIVFAAALALVGTGGTLYLRGGMPPAEVIRKLSGMRLALEFYRQDKKELPALFESVVQSGKLEGVPALKLSGHFKGKGVRNTPSLEIKDTGGWAYVSDKASPQFGLIYIDCSHKDPKGRPWSEF